MKCCQVRLELGRWSDWCCQWYGGWIVRCVVRCSVLSSGVPRAGPGQPVLHPATSFQLFPSHSNFLPRCFLRLLTPPLSSLPAGCCYAFASTAAVQSLVAIRYGTNNLYNFAPQQIVDCSSPYGNNGCKGGLASKAYSYIINKGLTYESYYPYKGAVGSCKVSSVSE